MIHFKRVRSERAFTLLEVLMAFGVGSMLLGVMYFFYFGIMKTGVDAGTRIDLNDIADRALQAIAGDLRNTTAITELRPHRLVLQRLPRTAISGEEMASIGSLHLTAVEYELVSEKDRPVRLERNEPNAIGNDAKHLVFQCDACKPEIFTGFVYDLPSDKDDLVPKFHLFDSAVQTSGDLPRITMVRVSLDMRAGKTNMQLVSKIFLPIAHNNNVQGTWNVE